MSRTSLRSVRSRPWPVLTLALRFFSGEYLDGQVRQTRGGVVLPKYLNYYWNRWSRGRRALWRNTIFWATASFWTGMAISEIDTLLAVGFLVSFLLGRVYEVFTRTTYKPAHQEVIVTEPVTINADKDDKELDDVVQAEQGTNLVEIQKLQAPKRTRKAQ